MKSSIKSSKFGFIVVGIGVVAAVCWLIYLSMSNEGLPLKSTSETSLPTTNMCVVSEVEEDLVTMVKEEMAFYLMRIEAEDFNIKFEYGLGYDGLVWMSETNGQFVPILERVDAILDDVSVDFSPLESSSVEIVEYYANGFKNRVDSTCRRELSITFTKDELLVRWKTGTSGSTQDWSFSDSVNTDITYLVSSYKGALKLGKMRADIEASGIFEVIAAAEADFASSEADFVYSVKGEDYER